MDIYSLHKQVKFNNRQNLFDLFEPTFFFRTDIPLGQYVVTIDEEMRPDLLLKNIYNIDYSLLDSFLEDIDVLLFINNINNPLNIKPGMIINYPLSIESFGSYRYASTDNSNNNDVLQQLVVPNYVDKTTRTDNDRQNYIENNYSLSPVVMGTPKDPISIQNGVFSIGGL